MCQWRGPAGGVNALPGAHGPGSETGRAGPSSRGGGQALAGEAHCPLCSASAQSWCHGDDTTRTKPESRDGPEHEIAQSRPLQGTALKGRVSALQCPLGTLWLHRGAASGGAGARSRPDPARSCPECALRRDSTGRCPILGKGGSVPGTPRPPRVLGVEEVHKGAVLLPWSTRMSSGAPEGPGPPLCVLWAGVGQFRPQAFHTVAVPMWACRRGQHAGGHHSRARKEEAPGPFGSTHPGPPRRRSC